jgi:hypothetical protein
MIASRMFDKRRIDLPLGVSLRPKRTWQPNSTCPVQHCTR